MMQRRVGKHEAKRLDAGRDRQRDDGIGSSFEQNNRAARRAKQLGFGFGYDAMLADQLNRSSHQSEGLILAVFSLSQALDRLPVQPVAGEMKSADAFDGDHRSCN